MSYLSKPTVCTILLSLANASILYAQIIPDKEKLSSNVRTVNPALQSQGGPISALSSINLTSLFNDTRAEIKVALLAGSSVFNVGVAQSFSKKPEVAKLLDASGLSTGTTFSAGFQTRIGRLKRPDIPPVKDINLFNQIKERFREDKKISKGKAISWTDLDQSTKTKLINSCVIDPKAFVSPLLFTFQFSASRVGFDYITDTLATKPLSSNETNKSFTFSLSKFTSLDRFWAISYTALYTYQSGDEVQSYSFPVGTKGLTYAKDVTVGTPTEKFESRLKAELRQLFRSGDCTPFLGINPSASVLFTSGKGNIDLPVYFITKDDKGLFNNLQAGFKVGYTSKLDESFLKDLGSFSSDKMYFSLFLSKPFSVQ